MFTLDQAPLGPLSAVRQTPTIPMANDLSPSGEWSGTNRNNRHYAVSEDLSAAGHITSSG